MERTRTDNAIRGLMLFLVPLDLGLAIGYGVNGRHWMFAYYVLLAVLNLVFVKTVYR